ncbi:MAG: nitroreductase family protein [Thermomicrobiales bacterium]
MPASNAAEIIEFIRRQRQTRQFTGEAVSNADIQSLLEIARWTGSAGNSQPWKFIVVRDAERRAALAASQPHTDFLKDAPLVIAPVMLTGSSYEDGYDEGRVSERVLLAATALGLGSGVVWFYTPDAIAKAREILNVPEGGSVQSAIGIGHPAPVDPNKPKRPNPRKSLDELVIWERYE